MSATAEREFQVNPNQYQLFRFSVSGPATLYINMIATAAVDVILLDRDDKAQYETGNEYTYTRSWGRRTSIDDAVYVDPGTWYIVVEGRDEPSRGRLKVYQ